MARRANTATADMPKAVIYARYSSHSQTEQSIEGQLRDCMNYAKTHDLKIVGEYIDRAMSGTNDNRPQFQKMISDSEKKSFKFVLVYKFDRFARNMYDSAIYDRKLEVNGVKVISVTEQIGEGNESIIVKALLRAMAEVYSKQLGENVRRGMRESALKANSVGGIIPLGYKIIDKKLVIDKNTAPIVKFIFEEYAQGKTKNEIVNGVTKKGYRKTNGKNITVQNITYILQNKKYIGLFTYKDIQIENGCESIVDKELFQKCMNRVQVNKKHYGRKKTPGIDFLLFSKLFCGLCGKPMSGDSGTSRSGEKHHYYTCYTRKNKNRFGVSCAKKSEKKGFLEWYIVSQTQEYILNSTKRIEEIATNMIKQYDNDFDNKKVENYKRKLFKIEDEINMVVDALIKTSNKTALDKINEKLEVLELQKEDIQIELTKLHIAADIKLEKNEIVEWLSSFCKGDPLDETFQKKIIDTFINAVYLYDDKIVIYYNCKGGKQVSCVDMLNHLDALNDELECSDSSLNGEPIKKTTL